MDSEIVIVEIVIPRLAITLVNLGYLWFPCTCISIQGLWKFHLTIRLKRPQPKMFSSLFALVLLLTFSSLFGTITFAYFFFTCVCSNCQPQKTKNLSWQREKGAMDRRFLCSHDNKRYATGKPIQTDVTVTPTRLVGTLLHCGLLVWSAISDSFSSVD